MAQVFNKMTIDINQKPNNIVTAVQDDLNSRFLDVILTIGSTPINLTGHEVRIWARKPEKSGEVFNNGVITEPTNGRCQFPLTSVMLEKAGYLEVQLFIYKDNVEVLKTQIFKLMVTESLATDSAVEGSNEYGALVVLFQNLYESYDLMTEMVQSIGVPTQLLQNMGLRTMYEVCSYLLSSLQQNTNEAVMKEVKDIITKIGQSTVANDATIFGKLNILQSNLEKVLYPSNNLQKTLVSNPINIQKNTANTLYTITKMNENFIVPYNGQIRVYVEAELGGNKAKSLYLCWTTSEGFYSKTEFHDMPVGNGISNGALIANIRLLSTNGAEDVSGNYSFILDVKKGDSLIFFGYATHLTTDVNTFARIKKLTLSYKEV